MPEPTHIVNLAVERERRSTALKPRYRRETLTDVVNLLDADAEQFSAVFQAMIGDVVDPRLEAETAANAIQIVVRAPALTLKIISKGADPEDDLIRFSQEVAAAGETTESQFGRAQQLHLAVFRVTSRETADEFRKFLLSVLTPPQGD